MTLINLKLAAAALVLAAPALGQEANSSIIGAWRMTSLQTTNPDGSVMDIPYSGQVIFSEAGTLSVQAMDANPDAEATTYTVNGYEAYYGPVEIDEEDGTFTITVESSLVRDLIGQQLTRVLEVDGDQLLITPANSEETWRVTYERM